MVGGGPNPKMGRILPWRRYLGSGVEGGGGDSQSPLHRLHHLRRLSSWVPVGSRYGYRHPRGQTALAGYVHDGGGTSRDLSAPAPGVRRLGQVQVPGDPGEIWRGSQGPPPPPQVLGEAPDGGAGGEVLGITLPWGERHGAGRPTFDYHIKCGGGCSCQTLGIIYGRRSWG